MTKSRSELEDESVEENSHKAPKDLPPRYDKRNRTVSEGSDPDLDGEDPDLSMNYKEARYHGPPGYLSQGDPQRPWQEGWSRKDIRELNHGDFATLLTAATTELDDKLLEYSKDVALRYALDHAIHGFGNGLYAMLIDSPTYNFLLAALNEKVLEGNVVAQTTDKDENTPFMTQGNTTGLASDSRHLEKNASEETVKKTASEIKRLSSELDKVATELQTNHKALNLSPRMAMSAAFHLDRVSDAMEKAVLSSTLETDPDEPYMDHYNQNGDVDGQQDADEASYMNPGFDGEPGQPSNESGDAVSGRTEPIELKHQAESNPWADAPSQQPSQPNVNKDADSRSYVSSYKPCTKAGTELHKQLFS